MYLTNPYRVVLFSISWFTSLPKTTYEIVQSVSLENSCGLRAPPSHMARYFAISLLFLPSIRLLVVAYITIYLLPNVCLENSKSKNATTKVDSMRQASSFTGTEVFVPPSCSL